MLTISDVGDHVVRFYEKWSLFLYVLKRNRDRLRSIVPGAYVGRTRHIHVKVQAPGGRILTTQLYFAGDPGNRRDGLYRPELEMKKGKGEETSFDFVVPA